MNPKDSNRVGYMLVKSQEERISKMPAPYHPLAIANEFIGFSEGYGVSHMKLQKLVYCAHGWWLHAKYPERIVNEDPEVWQHGPVFPGLYRVLSGLGSQRVQHMRPAAFGNPPARVDDQDDEALELLRFTWARYGGKTAFELSDMTHRPGTPWQQIAARHDYRVPRHTPIPAELIRDEFRRIAAREAA